MYRIRKKTLPTNNVYFSRLINRTVYHPMQDIKVAFGLCLNILRGLESLNSGK